MDFNPITPSKSGTIDEWLERNYNYDKYKENMKEYAKYIIDCFKEKFQDKIKFVYKITFLKDKEQDRYIVRLAVNLDNAEDKDQIIFMSIDKFNKLSLNEQMQYMGNIYNVSLIGKEILDMMKLKRILYEHSILIIQGISKKNRRRYK